MSSEFDQLTFSCQIVRGAKPTVLHLAIYHILNMRFKTVANVAAVQRVAGVVDDFSNLENRSGSCLVR